jgi:hypothetical protein
MPQSLHYSIITILLLRNRAHQRTYIQTTLHPLPTVRTTYRITPLTGLVCLNIYNVWVSVINLSTITGLPLARSLVRPSSRIRKGVGQEML